MDQLRYMLNHYNSFVREPQKVCYSRKLPDILDSQSGICSDAVYFLAHHAKNADIRFEVLASLHDDGKAEIGHRSLIALVDSHIALFSRSDKLPVRGEIFDTCGKAENYFAKFSYERGLPIVGMKRFWLDREISGWDEPQVDLSYIDGTIGDSLITHIENSRDI